MRNEINPRLALLALALLIPTSLQAQTPPPAPLPTAITTAQKLFLGNAGDTDNQDCLRAYNEFYAGIAGYGRYQLVLDPSAADLILELHYEVRAGGITGPHSPVDTAFARQFRLVLIDPHTRAVLWSFTEAENNAVFQSNRNKNLDAAMTKLLTDFVTLGQPAATPAPPTKK